MSTKIQLRARVYWKLVFEYNNLDNKGTITQTYHARTHTSSSRSSFNETVSREATTTNQKASVSADASVSYGIVSANVSSSYEWSKEVNDLLEKTIRSSSEQTVEKEQTFDRTYTIGPRSKLSLYQKCLDGPGMSVTFDVFSTDVSRANQSEDLIINVTVELIDYIKNLRVVYTGSPADAPGDRLRERNNGNPDINAGFKGEYVWLVPEYTRDASQAATAFDMITQSNGNAKYSDLAKGAGGDFRYLIPVNNVREKAKIVECALLRTGSVTNVEQIKQMGWAGMSADINRGRKGDFLYLIWKIRGPF